MRFLSSGRDQWQNEMRRCYLFSTLISLKWFDNVPIKTAHTFIFICPPPPPNIFQDSLKNLLKPFILAAILAFGVGATPCVNSD